ncbi:MAG: hypothetical protein HON14_08870, partial [Rhodospirillaceae bacterium]|nr:hypothetical protein [Rhodospirillaceae bacterium]
FNLITTAKRSGKRVIGVVFGGNTSRSRNRHMKTLLTRAFSKTTAPMQMAKIAKPARSKESSTTNKNRIWGIQVGAFYTHRPALNIATDISNKYASVLNGGKVKVMPLRKSRNRVLYRARILGLNRRNAYRTCRLLKKHRKPCLALNLPSNVEVASR